MCVCPSVLTQLCVCSPGRVKVSARVSFCPSEKHTPALVCLHRVLLAENNEFLHSDGSRFPPAGWPGSPSLALLQLLIISEPEQWKVPAEARLRVTSRRPPEKPAWYSALLGGHNNTRQDVNTQEI